MPTPDKLTETYDAWSRATDQHKAMMVAVMGGKPLDAEAMHAKTAEIDRLHEDWMALAKQLGK